MNLAEVCEMGSLKGGIMWTDKEIASIPPRDLQDQCKDVEIEVLKPDANQALIQIRALLPTRPDVGKYLVLPLYFKLKLYYQIGIWYFQNI